MDLFRQTNIDFVGKIKICLTISGLVILAGLISLFIKGGPNYGIDFTGGLLVQAKFGQAVHADEVRSALKEIDLGNSMIQDIGSNEILIRVVGWKSEDVEGSEAAEAKKLETVLKERFSSKQVEIRKIEVVGPRVGKELRKSAILAALGALAGILIYTGIRFQVVWGSAAILSLAHDTLVTLGIFSLLNKEFDLTVLAALLTIIGFSINDTIVVFDRIRENMHLSRKQSLVSIVNMSLNQTLSRTILTSFTVFLGAISLFIFGGDVIHNFAFAMLIGIVTGTYSSIYIAVPLLVVWEKARESRKKKRFVQAKDDIVALRKVPKGEYSSEKKSRMKK